MLILVGKQTAVMCAWDVSNTFQIRSFFVD